MTDRIGSMEDTLRFLSHLEHTCLRKDVMFEICGSASSGDPRDFWDYVPELDLFRGAILVSLILNDIFTRLFNRRLMVLYHFFTPVSLQFRRVCDNGAQLSKFIVATHKTHLGLLESLEHALEEDSFSSNFTFVNDTFGERTRLVNLHPDPVFSF